MTELIVDTKPDKGPNLLSSYRPISPLSILSKIYEKLLLKRIRHSLEHIEAIPKH